MFFVAHTGERIGADQIERGEQRDLFSVVRDWDVMKRGEDPDYCGSAICFEWNGDERLIIEGCVVSRLGFDPSTLALKGHNPHNKPIPIFHDFFILSHFPILHYTDTFHMDPGSCRQTSTNLERPLTKKTENSAQKTT